jgi:large subunit ribosomal protein L17
MRHRVNKVKLGRTGSHREAMLANMAVSLIQKGRIKTTLAKAKALRPFAEKLVTLGKKGSVHHRRLAFAAIRERDAVSKLFDEIAKKSATRNGGYTRIIKLGFRIGDAAPEAFIEWVDNAPVVETAEPETKKASKKPAPRGKKDKGEADKPAKAKKGKKEAEAKA